MVVEKSPPKEYEKKGKKTAYCVIMLSCSEDRKPKERRTQQRMMIYDVWWRYRSILPQRQTRIKKTQSRERDGVQVPGAGDRKVKGEEPFH